MSEYKITLPDGTKVEAPSMIDATRMAKAMLLEPETTLIECEQSENEVDQLVAELVRE